MRGALTFSIGALVLAGCGGDTGAATHFGALVPLTGALADSGPQIQQAFLLAGNRINAAGGVAGHPIRIHVTDTRSDPQRGLVQLVVG